MVNLVPYWAQVTLEILYSQHSSRRANFMGKKVSIVITNWNGKALLDQCLLSALRAVNLSEGSHEIIVVDDASTDGSVQHIQTNYPSVKVIRLKKNGGFSKASNAGVSASINEIVVFLNNDVVVREDFLKPLINHFDDPSVFAVGPKIFWGDRKTVLGGKSRACFKRGTITVDTVTDSMEIDECSLNLFVGGGAGAFDRTKFIGLGGFDDLYYPLYYEDLDICYRAWKRGWKMIYEPNSVVFHNHSSTINGQLGFTTKEIMARKNFLLFHWKNITDKNIIFYHTILIPVRILKALSNRKRIILLSYWYALKQLRQVLRKRRKEVKYYKFTDRKVIQFLKNRDVKNKI